MPELLVVAEIDSGVPALQPITTICPLIGSPVIWDDSLTEKVPAGPTAAEVQVGSLNVTGAFTTVSVPGTKASNEYVGEERLPAEQVMGYVPTSESCVADVEQAGEPE